MCEYLFSRHAKRAPCSARLVRKGVPSISGAALVRRGGLALHGTYALVSSGWGVRSVVVMAKTKPSNNPPPQIILAGFFHLDGHDIAHGQRLETLVDKQVPVDLGRIGLGPAGRGLIINLVHDDVDARANLCLQLGF